MRPRKAAREIKMSTVKRTRINDALRIVRLYWGFTQKELSEKLEISQSLISEIESGRKAVTLDVLECYSDKLGIRLSQLMFFAEEVENLPPSHRGKHFVAEKVLDLLEKFAPEELIDAKV